MNGDYGQWLKDRADECHHDMQEAHRQNRTAAAHQLMGQRNAYRAAWRKWHADHQEAERTPTAQGRE